MRVSEQQQSMSEFDTNRMRVYESSASCYETCAISIRRFGPREGTDLVPHLHRYFMHKSICIPRRCVTLIRIASHGKETAY